MYGFTSMKGENNGHMNKDFQWEIGVSKNRGTPKWMVYNGKPYFSMDDLGVPLFSETSKWAWYIFQSHAGGASEDAQPSLPPPRPFQAGARGATSPSGSRFSTLRVVLRYFEVLGPCQRRGRWHRLVGGGWKPWYMVGYKSRESKLENQWETRNVHVITEVTLPNGAKNLGENWKIYDNIANMCEN